MRVTAGRRARKDQEGYRALPPEGHRPIACGLSKLSAGTFHRDHRLARAAPAAPRASQMAPSRGCTLRPPVPVPVLALRPPCHGPRPTAHLACRRAECHRPLSYYGSRSWAAARGGVPGTHRGPVVSRAAVSRTCEEEGCLCCGQAQPALAKAKASCSHAARHPGPLAHCPKP